MQLSYISCDASKRDRDLFQGTISIGLCISCEGGIRFMYLIDIVFEKLGWTVL